MKNIMLAPLNTGADIKNIILSTEQIPTERVIIVSKQKLDEERIRGLFEKRGIEVEFKHLTNDVYERIFTIVKLTKEKYENVVINIAGADNLFSSAVTCAAYLYKLYSFTVINNELIMLPLFKFSCELSLTPQKWKILKALQREHGMTFKELGKDVGMSPSLISYHLNGDIKSKGLKELGLIESDKSTITVSLLGKIIMQAAS